MFQSTKTAWRLWMKFNEVQMAMLDKTYPGKLSAWFWATNNGRNPYPMPHAKLERWLAGHLHVPSLQAVRSGRSWEAKVRALIPFAGNLLRSTPVALTYAGFFCATLALGTAARLASQMALPLGSAILAAIVTLPEIPHQTWRGGIWSVKKAGSVALSLRHLPLRDPQETAISGKAQAPKTEEHRRGSVSRHLPKLTLPSRKVDGPGRHLGE